MAQKKKKNKLDFQGKDLEYYEALMKARETVLTQMRYHVDEALDCSNAEKRGVTTHMADVSNDNSRHEMELRLLSEDGDVLKLIEGDDAGLPGLFQIVEHLSDCIGLASLRYIQTQDRLPCHFVD